ncbi:carboxy-S-adenosyl-L-methionine synthase CmoA [Marinicella sp. W31]|uniref:carboxy-S-adenosyl-L-methionine synthase CmoA n=1 Tax=Marinicella sp. W31 TaxID=3023713 RepID=UPI00375849C5
MENKDKIFTESFKKVKAFAFDEQVVNVFPDMIKRSVPGYDTILRGIALYAMKYIQQPSQVFDLGCSLGAVAFTIDQALGAGRHKIHAIDSSEPMIQGLQQLLSTAETYNEWIVSQRRIQDIGINDAGMVVSNFTLQFIPPDDRQNMLQAIYDGLNPGGVFVLSEKVKSSQLLIDHYHGYKKVNGYSDQEIMRKRDALENILIPDSKQHWEMALKQAGFSAVELWFQAFNFVSWLCIKDA